MKKNNKNNNQRIMVMGSGSWGTALANHLAYNGCEVYINCRKQNIVDEINNNNSNSQYLPNIVLHKNIKAGINIDTNVSYVFIVVPSDKANDVFHKIAQHNFNKDCVFIICCKGFDSKNFDLLSDSFEKIINGKNYAILSGPNFAIEVASFLPTVTTIASVNKKIAKDIIKILNSKNLKAFYFEDPRTTEVCGIVKNILAIGCGIVDGLGLGVNAKSALLVKGIVEIQKICKKIKASTKMTTPAGFGDIFLTCSSDKSRNNKLGAMIAKGEILDNKITYEGMNSAKIIIYFAKKHKLKLDLCEAISKIIAGKYSPTEIKSIVIKAILS